MATGTPFHPRTAPRCRSHDWRQWSGYLAVGSYDDFVQPEYAAIRHAAAVIDISPLYKYWVEGPEAGAVLDRVFTHQIGQLPVGRAAYSAWCDSAGRVRQEGTVFRLDDRRFQINAAEPALGWFAKNANGHDATFRDRSTDIAALSIQGPRSRDLLAAVAGPGVRDLRFFHCMAGTIGGAPVTISRTGYTGDLGYEVWLDAGDALRVWDALFEGGRDHRITPCGLKAMDVARVEAGFVLINVDYVSAESALIEADTVSPYELGLGWSVKLEKPQFVGRAALEREHRAGPARRVVGLEIDWEPLESLFLAAGRMPDLPLIPDREPVPVYAPRGGRQIGRATTRLWSALLKKYLALATVDAAHAQPGRTVELEVTVHYERKRAAATVVPLPFFRPERMKT